VSDRRSSSDLGADAEAILSAFPIPERDWESQARAVEARLSEAAHGSADAALLAAPLPSEPGEPSSLSATATPLTNSGVRTQSLTELARRSVEKKQANERQMARESLALAARQREQPARSDAPPPPASVSHVVATSPARAEAPVGSSNHWPKVALALPALALAAAALLWFRQPEPAPLVTNPSTEAAPSAAAANAVDANSAVARSSAANTPDLPRGVDPNSLPGEVAPEADPARVAVAAAPVAKSGQNKVALKGDRANPEAVAVDRGLPPDPALRPADSHSGDLPNKPSTGAVQSALGSVMSGARHCVAGDDAPSSAVVVFGSDGRVQQVTVSGPAAGKSSATCIEAQLRRARVQPFAASNFSVNATVRPE
jgi:hypothetical protein